jgi:AraC family transcriptional regulator
MDQQSKLFIKGMVCNRCVSVVGEALNELGHREVKVSLGEIANLNENYPIDTAKLEGKLAIHGFSILEDQNLRIVNEVKALVAEVYSGEFEFPEKFRFANLLATRFFKGYDKTRDVFIAMEQKSLEQYIIEFRINKVKEFLVYSSSTLADIAYRLNFTSVAHLSSQFKQQTGLTPSFFKGIQNQKAEVVFATN